MKAYFENVPATVPDYKRNIVTTFCEWMFFIYGMNCKAKRIREIFIPCGYSYDGASIPRIFWSIIGSPFEPRYAAAALAHDWLYFTHILSRDIADEIFRQLLIQCGVSRARARIMWTAVRVGGLIAWKNTLKENGELYNMKKQLEKEGTLNKYFPV